MSTLPNELLLEIVSHFPSDPLTLSAPSTTHIARREALRSLSEVCRNFRRVFRPYLWQRVEVYAGLRAGTQILRHSIGTCVKVPKPKRDFMKELLRQLNVVTIQDPGLAQHVRIVDIEVNEACLRLVFAELGRCFSLFPNLHTVKIITKFSGYYSNPAEGAAKRGFKRSILYPQIRSAILTQPIYPLLAVCPNLVSLAPPHEFPWSWEYMKGLTALQKLLCPLSLTNAAVIGSELPSLQQVTIALPSDRVSDRGRVLPSVRQRESLTTRLIKAIRSFTNLRTLILQGVTDSRRDVTRATLKQAFLDLSRRDRQNLREVIFAGYSYPAGRREEEIFTLPPF